jgi:hypothetical protein
MTAKPKRQATPATPDDLDARLNALAARLAALEARIKAAIDAGILSAGNDGGTLPPAAPAAAIASSP